MLQQEQLTQKNQAISETVKLKAFRVGLFFYRQIKAQLEKVQVMLRWFPHRNYIPAPHDIHMIPTDQLEMLTNFKTSYCTHIKDRNFVMQKNRGKILNGDWDITDHFFNDLAVAKAIRERVELNRPWDHTYFFKESMAEIQKGRRLWKCRNETDFRARLKFVDQIIEDMQLNGYKTGFESCVQGEDPDKISNRKGSSDEITINIGRDGSFLFQDGRHRLAIAKSLHIKKIPVKILVRHQEWVNFLMKDDFENLDGEVLFHPDVLYRKKILNSENDS